MNDERTNRRGTAASQGGEDASRVDQRAHDLIVVRESDVSDQLLMLDMLMKTMEAYRDVPGTERAKEVGLQPLLNPEEFDAVTKRTQRHRMVLFHLDSTLFLYAMGSAAKIDEETQLNDYAEFLLEVLNVYRPRNLRLAGITRLLRSTAFANKFEGALSEHRILLHAEGSTYDVTTMDGRIIYQMLASFAAFERDQIVTRTLIGRIATARRGGLIFRPTDLPLGYVHLDGKVVPDPSKREQVQTLLASVFREGW